MEVARRCGWHHSKCSRIENGKTPPADADIRAWCAACDAEDQIPNLIAASRAAESAYLEWRRATRGGLRRVQEAVVPLWQRTRLFRVYEPSLIPGLFQTSGYATALLERIGTFYRTRDDPEAAATARIERQRVLRSGEHRFAVVVEEAALRTGVGAPEVMADQLGHLLSMTMLAPVSLGVIPFSAGRAMWPVEGFWIYDDSRVVVETVSAKITVTAPQEIDLYVRTFAELAVMAIYGQRARELITSAIDALG